MIRKSMVLIVSLSVLLISSCGNEQSKVDEVLHVVLEDDDSVVVEALEENEIDVKTKYKIEAELKQMVAEMTGYEVDAIALMISLVNEPSCSMVLPTEGIVEDRVIKEIKNHLISKLSETYSVPVDEDSIVITNSKNVLLSESYN